MHRNEPRNGPAESKHSGVGEKLFQQITAKVKEDHGHVLDALQEATQGLDTRLAKVEGLNRIDQNEALTEAVERILGLEDINRIWDSSPEASVERLPVLLRRLNDRVGDLEVIIQEADKRADAHREESWEPRAHARAMYAEELANDINLQIQLNTDPRLTTEYAKLTDKYLRGRPFSQDDAALAGRAQDFVRLTGQDPSRDNFPTMLDLHNKTAAEVLNSLSTVYAPSAGWAVAPTEDRRIRQIMSEFSAIIDLANKPATSSNRYVWYQEKGDMPTITGGREETSPTQTDVPAFEGWEPRSCDIFHLTAEVPITRDLLEDANFDILGLLVNMVGRQMAIQLSTWCLNGTGVDSPLGLLNDSNVPTLNTGVADEVTLVSLALLGATPKAGYARNGVYILGDDCYKAALIEIDDSGRPKWQPTVADGTPALLTGYRVFRDTYFDSGTVTPSKVTFTSGDKVAWFGDPMLHFIMPQRRGMLVVRDETTRKPTALEYSWDSRVGFAVDLREAGAVLVVNT